MTAPLQDLQTEWASLLISALADAGVRDVVASPGSRSTPFALAAAREPRLRCLVVVDERSAAFVALGQARATGRPSLLLCTSGTAPAHYLPAIIEASQAHVPLLVLSADRPLDLQDCAAPQTVDQLKLFGDHVRRFVELGLPESSPGALRAVRRRAAQAAFDALHPLPGPVHLNVRARKPLEPHPASEAELEQSRCVRDAARKPTPRAFLPQVLASKDALDQVAQALRRARRPLAVAGPASVSRLTRRDDVTAFLEASGVPLLCDATSQLRFGAPPHRSWLDASDLLLSSPRLREAKPDLLLQLGAAPTTAGWESLVDGACGVTHVVLAEHGWNDPANTASLLVYGDEGHTLRGLAERLRGHATTLAGWTDTLRCANAAAWHCVDELLDSSGHLSEARAARTLVSMLPSGAALVVGNGLPIRLVDAHARAGTRELAVYSQRGANGIDGLVSGAAGTALATGRTTALLLGDLSLLHDLGGLAAARAVRAPFVIVVLQNDGGRIFEQLPVARAGLSEAELRLFTTPHGIAFRGAAETFGLPYARVDSPAQLEASLARALEHPGCTLIEAIVPPHEAATMRAELLARVDAEFEPLFSGGAS